MIADRLGGGRPAGSAATTRSWPPPCRPSSINPRPFSHAAAPGHGAASSGSCRRMPDRAVSASPVACPREWHGEDETPGIDIVMAGLAPSSRPHDVAFADWTFSGVVKDLGRLSAYLADRLGWAARDRRAAPSSSAISSPRPGPTAPARASTLPENQPFFFGGADEQSMHSKGRSRRRAAVRPRLDLARRRADDRRNRRRCQRSRYHRRHRPSSRLSCRRSSSRRPAIPRRSPRSPAPCR